jgi:hypothetical protein
MSDILSQRIRSLNNDTINRRDYCYITTNETGISNIRKILQTKKRHENSCHIGVSGYYNFDIMCITRPSRCILFDNNINQIRFLKYTLDHIKKSCTRFIFYDNICKFLFQTDEIMKSVHKSLIEDYGFHNYNMEKLHESGIMFWPNISDDNFSLTPSKEIKYELLRIDSWLGSDENYKYIQELALNDKISIICEDIRNTSRFVKIINILQSSNIQIDTIYLSNIGDYMLCDDDILSYNNSLELFKINSETIIRSDKYKNIQFIN